MSDQAQKIVGNSAKSKAWIFPTLSILFCALRAGGLCVKKDLRKVSPKKIIGSRISEGTRKGPKALNALGKRHFVPLQGTVDSIFDQD
jgi:hypothetical protein